jgi:sulfoxide reductase heme-binding subunit YedZ
LILGPVPALIAPPSPIWFFARAAGFTSLLILTASVCLGILLTLRVRSRNWPLFLSDELHAYTAVVFFVFVTLHVVTVLIDPFTRFGLADVLVPFATSYRTVWMGLGILSLELSLALGLSVYIRRWIGYRAWRVLHYGTYSILPMALVHGMATGTDTSSSWGIAVYGVCIIAVLAVIGLRLAQSTAPVRAPLAAAVALGMLVLVSWLATGPLRPGWARVAGTPQLMSASGSPAAATPAPPLALARPFSDRITGSVTAQPEEGNDLQAGGRATGPVDLRWSLDFQQDAAGNNSGTLTIAAADGTAICTANIVGAGNQGIEATCMPAGAKGSIDLVLRLRQRSDGFLSGVLQVTQGPTNPVPAPSPRRSAAPAI